MENKRKTVLHVELVLVSLGKLKRTNWVRLREVVLVIIRLDKIALIMNARMGII